MTTKIFAKEERKNIFKLFLSKNKLEFNEIEKALNMRSNKLAYHIKTLVKENILEKKDNFYIITPQAQKFIPLFSNIANNKLSPLPVVLTALKNKFNQILLIKRTNRPYKDYWSMIGGRMLYDEDYKQTSFRLIKTKSGIRNVDFVGLGHIADEKVYENGILKNSFHLFFTITKTKDEKLIESKYGELKWFSLEDIKSNKLKIIPSDKWLIEKFLNKEMKISKVVMREENDELINFEVE